MKTTKRMRVSMLAVVALLVGGVVAVLACGPSAAPEQQSGSAGDVPESVSVPATEAPFVLQQSGDGGGGQSEPTDEPTATPVPAVDVASHPRVGHRLGQHYTSALMGNSEREVVGEDQEFPVMPVFVTTTPAGEDAVANFLEANGGVDVTKDPDASVGHIASYMNIGMIPELLDVAGFIRVDLDIQSAYRIPPSKKLVDLDGGRVSGDLKRQYIAVKAGVQGRESRGAESAGYPVVRVVIEVGRAALFDYVLKYVKSGGGENISENRTENGGTIEVDLSLESVKELAWVDGVMRVTRAKSRVQSPGVPSGSSGRAERAVTPTSTPMPASESMRADEWHRAGFTGTGVEVAVLDYDFREFRTRILPNVSGSVSFLCYQKIAKLNSRLREQQQWPLGG